MSCGECVAACPTGALTNKPIRDVPIRPRNELDAVDTVCPYCGVGCALTYYVDRERQAISFAEGREQPGSHGRLCVKGRPGKPTLLAECDGVPVIGLPGNPRSALVVFRLLGVPLVRLVGGCTMPPPEPAVRARLARDLPSAAGRLDVVQVQVAGGVATPVFGLSALLSVLTAADGYVIIPEEATGLDAGTEVEVTVYR